MEESQKEYRELASLYDYLVAEIDYEGWFDYMQEILNRLDYKPQSVADLACGTGETTIPFARQGLTTYGVDISKEMLEIAEKKLEKVGSDDLDIKYLEQDMKELDLPESVDLVVCYHDGMNYILSLTALHRVFSRVYENLNNGGYFIFDINTINRFREAAKEREITVIDEEEKFLAWKTDYEEKTDIWTIELTGFIKVKEDLYRRFEEVHREKDYSEGEVLATLRESGFKVSDYYEAFSWQKPDYNSSRIMYIAKKE
jgi:ubiquinone/menaquinone biosynthesis C-methylase UbiE